jgi:hypothetical protein
MTLFAGVQIADDTSRYPTISRPSQAGSGRTRTTRQDRRQSKPMGQNSSGYTHKTMHPDQKHPIGVPSDNLGDTANRSKHKQA